MDRWGTGFLSLDGGALDYGPEPGAAASRSNVAVAGPDTLVATANLESQGCAVGDIGEYRWSVEGKDTVMTLAAIGPDACVVREKALAGMWVRADLPVAGGGSTMAPGTYGTSAFDPFDRPGVPGQLWFTLPRGWAIEADTPASIALRHPPDAAASSRSTDTFIAVFAQPRVAAALDDGVPCAGPPDAPGVGDRVDDIVAAIMARAGVISTVPVAVTIGGYEGREIELNLAPAWTGGCQAAEGTVVGIPILKLAGSGVGPMMGVAPDHPLRLILLDLTGGRAIAIALFVVGAAQPALFEEQVAAAMPVVESFEFHAPAP
jgi:hypothetical protein